MQFVLKQVLKQANKVNRILSKLSEEYPKLSQQIDIALYAIIKIEKEINKFTFQSKQDYQILKINDYKAPKLPGSDDVIYQTALQNIETFKNATYRLERKMNVIISESQNKRFQRHDRNVKNNLQLEEKNQIIKNKVNFKKDKLRDTEMLKLNIKHIQESDQSSHLSDIDAGIIQLAKQLAKEMGNDSKINSYSYVGQDDS